MNGVGAIDFAADMGFSFKKLVQLEEVALSRLAACGGLTAELLEEQISWSGQRTGNVQMAFRNEVFGSRVLRNPTVRGCPICLRKDVEAKPSHPLTEMTMRGDWQLREASVCVEHSHLLVPLWKCSRPEQRYDLQSRFSDILPDIIEGKLECSPAAPSPYDFWLETRLETGADNTWLAGKSLYGATTFCRLLGTELLRLTNCSDLDLSEKQRLAQELGFGAICHGEDAIQAALRSLVELTDGRNFEPGVAFGKLYSVLQRDHVETVEFTPFRKALRDCIVDSWPIAAGEVVLGFPQHERKMHSVRTAASTTKTDPFALEKILVHVGAIEADDNRPISQKTFDAGIYADLLDEVPTLVGRSEMHRAMGATLKQFVSLESNGFLEPRFSLPDIRSRWRISDGKMFVEELEKASIPVTPSESGWEGIHQANSRTNLGIGVFINKAREGKIQLGRKTDCKGYAAFVLRKSEVDQLSLAERAPLYRDLITAAAFGRSVGIRIQGWFENLSLAGHTPATRMPHPKWGDERVYASPSDIGKFHSRFLTSSTMEEEFNQNRRVLIAKLKAANVKPFAPNGDEYGPLFLREEVEAVLR